jgi:hypothetical protein
MPWKEWILESFHSKRWRQPFRFATVLAAALPLSIYLAEDHSDELHVSLSGRFNYVEPLQINNFGVLTRHAKFSLIRIR